ncbi:hypothetical protein L1887_58659 [Cichorium endivia]|nr:hypothetical protein L1887_58659 [Cichorium endivia]
MARNTLFVKRLLERLSHPKAVVRLNLLRLTKMMCDLRGEARSPLVGQLHVYEAVERLSVKDNAVLVKELARDILSQRHAEREVGRTVRRTLSDTHMGEGNRSPPGVGTNSPSSVAAALPGTTALGQMVGMRASAPYRRKISNGTSGDAATIHERSISTSLVETSPSSSRSAAMRGLVTRLGQPRRSVTPNRELMSESQASSSGSFSSRTSPLMPMDPLPQGEVVRQRQHSQPHSMDRSGSTPPGREFEKKLPTLSVGHVGMRAMSPRMRSISNEVKLAAAKAAAVGDSYQPQQRSPLMHGSVDSGPRRVKPDRVEAENGEQMDRDRTMRPPSRRPIPSLPPAHGFS